MEGHDGRALQALVNKYGPPTHTAEDETKRTVIWQNAQGPNTKIELTGHHVDDGTAYIEIAYHFSNLKSCTAEFQGGL